MFLVFVAFLTNNNKAKNTFITFDGKLGKQKDKPSLRKKLSHEQQRAIKQQREKVKVKSKDRGAEL